MAILVLYNTFTVVMPWCDIEKCKFVNETDIKYRGIPNRITGISILGYRPSFLDIAHL